MQIPPCHRLLLSPICREWGEERGGEREGERGRGRVERERVKGDEDSSLQLFTADYHPCLRVKREIGGEGRGEEREIISERMEGDADSFLPPFIAGSHPCI